MAHIFTIPLLLHALALLLGAGVFAWLAYPAVALDARWKYAGLGICFVLLSGLVGWLIGLLVGAHIFGWPHKGQFESDALRVLRWLAIMLSHSGVILAPILALLFVIGRKCPRIAWYVLTFLALAGGTVGYLSLFELL